MTAVRNVKVLFDGLGYYLLWNWVPVPRTAPPLEHAATYASGPLTPDELELELCKVDTKV